MMNHTAMKERRKKNILHEKGQQDSQHKNPVQTRISVKDIFLLTLQNRRDEEK